MPYFVVQKNGKDTSHVYTGRFPSQAAKKAALDKHAVSGILKLRKRGTDKVHCYKVGKITRVAAPPHMLDFGVKTVRKVSVKKMATGKCK